MPSSCLIPDPTDTRVPGGQQQRVRRPAQPAAVKSGRDRSQGMLRLGMLRSVAETAMTTATLASVFAASVTLTLAAVAMLRLVDQFGDDEHVAHMEVKPNPDALYAYDFSSDDMKLPSGAVPESRDIRLGTEAEPEQRGLIATVSGYVLPSGTFKQHGGWVVWWDEEKTVEAEVGGARHGRKHGPTVAFYRDGQRAREEAWVHGVRHGVSRTWDDGAVCRTVERYFDGQLEGPAESWHANGQKQSECHWREGHQLGSVATWREDGSPKSGGGLSRFIRSGERNRPAEGHW